MTTTAAVIGTNTERCDGKRMFRYEWQAKRAVRMQRLRDNRCFGTYIPVSPERK